MARLNQWAFRGFNLNQPGVRVRDMTGEFGLPPLRGSDFLTMGRTGQLWVPKLPDERHISLEIVVYEDAFGSGVGGAQGFFDQLAILFANRTQGALAYTDLTGYTRTGQAECVAWTPADQSVVGRVFKGVADFLLADPWLYGPTITGSVVPNAGLAFGTPAGSPSNISGPRTTWAVALSGVTSGQPILVVHATEAYNTVLTSIADTFAGHYTYVKVDGNNTNQDLEIYIGTGGTGTSGTVTITAPSGAIGGYVIPMIGASTAVGLLAVDVHANATGTYPVQPSISMTPTASWEGALVAVLAQYPSATGGSWTPSPNFTRGLSYLAQSVEDTAFYLYPTSGSALVVTDAVFSGIWDMVGAVIKGSGAASTLNITNTGTATAEKLTLDFLGPIGNPTIYNPTTGTSVTINVTVAGSTHLLVDTGAFTALNNGVNVIGSVVHAIVPGVTSWLTLAPGANALQVSGAACTGATVVTVSFAPPYL
jgi:hypothetical protein